ncbi:hypothetical protein B484DRAFT_478475 [Ochromonadaceae sp. CCMP2298]|nr:hypothetical protein B484DRAFT_478475 [Ochromonadaceae sp. CCMP2298]|mmetsp:Transcript_32108/g.71367  ORF Transcript_32108/g.71367 Transcript_32108/m.71367 type:complete len:1436 (+) Transcript_32108:141-4448(+)
MSASICVRRADFDDSKDLVDLVNKTGGASICKATFGNYNFSSLVENSYLSLLAEEQAEDVDGVFVSKTVSFVAVNDSVPLISDTSAYGRIIEALSNYIPATMSNVSFINFWILNENADCYESACHDMLRDVFAACANVDYLAWVLPKNFAPSDFMLRLFSQINFQTAEERAHPSIAVLEGFRVLFVHRSNYLPRLLVREARVEDNDDLLPILQHSNPDILEGQESFFLADLIQSQDRSNSFYVGLHRGGVAGMLATSLDVNVSLIMKIFDIEAFPDIIIKKAERPLPPPLLICVVGDIRLVDTVLVEEAVRGMNCVFVNAETMDLPLPLDAGPTEEEPVSARGAESKKGDMGAEGEEKRQERHEPAGFESPLNRYIDGLMSEHAQQSGAPPSAVVLFGYPRSENEAYERLGEVLYRFDYVVEVLNTSEDAEEDEEDDFLQHHLDALEVVREQYFASEGKTYTSHHSNHHHENHQHHAPLQGQGQGHRASWRKVSVLSDGLEDGHTEAVGLLNADLARILDHRNSKIEAQRAKDNEEPPKANAFAVTVFSLTDECLSRGQDLVKIAFEDHPQNDYCLYMVPNDRPPPTALTQCFSFVRTRPGVSFDQSLYLMHRSCFLVNDHMQVSRLTERDLHDVEELGVSLSSRERAALREHAHRSVEGNEVELRDNPSEVLFAVTVGKSLVGAIALSRKIVTAEDAAWFSANYHVDELVNLDRHRTRSQAVITQWVLDPVFSPFSRRILQEIMRQYGKSLLYYHAERDVCPPKEVLEEFVSLKPRRRMQSGGKQQPLKLVARPSAALGALGNDCPLFCITKNFLSKPKDTVAKRVVVVGGSSHAFALLSTLCSVPYLNLPNIYVVLEKAPAPLTLGSEEEESKEGEEFSGCFSVQDEEFPLQQELFALGLAHKVNLFKGHLTDIDRQNRAIVVSDRLVIEYDVLVLSTATQDGSTKQIPSLGHLHPARCADVGVFSLGNPASDALALAYIRKRYPNRSDDIVVSGSGLPVFAAVARLLKLGLDPMRITVVVHEEEGKIQGLKEKSVTDVLLKSALSAGVKMCWGCDVAETHLSHTGFLSSVELRRTEELKRSRRRGSSQQEMKGEPDFEQAGIMISCLALLCCSNQQCDRDVFNAAVDSGLVFDGGLVVDNAFCTVDKSIYALSDFTRFSRVYRDAVPHNRYNPREVGSFVALKILEQSLDPSRSRPHDYANPSAATSALQPSYAEPSRSKRPPLPVFQLPRAESCELPGGLHFFHARLPVVPAEATSYLTNGQSHSEVHFGAGPRNRNCVLKTDSYGTVAEFVYVGEDRVETRNLALVPGMHETYLNSAVHCHAKGFVADWIEFFRLEWACALFQDKFPVLVQALRKVLAADKGMGMILTRVFERAENAIDDQEVAEFRREFLGAHGELAPEASRHSVETEAMDFLKLHRRVLPTYYLPNSK